MPKMTIIQFNKSQLDYLRKLKVDAEVYAIKGHELAIADVKALTKAIDRGIPSRHLVQMLRDNINQIDSDPIWALTSSDQVEMMVGILNTIGFSS